MQVTHTLRGTFLYVREHMFIFIVDTYIHTHRQCTWDSLFKGNAPVCMFIYIHTHTHTHTFMQATYVGQPFRMECSVRHAAPHYRRH